MTESRRRTNAAAAILCTLWLAGAGSAQPATSPDAERGKQLHAKCQTCHTADFYVDPRRRVQTMQELRDAVRRWAQTADPKVSRRDIADLTEYLNQDYYHFPAK